MKLTRTQWITLLGLGTLLVVSYLGWRYAQTYEMRLFALDARTGHVKWSTPLKLDFAPSAANGRVFVYSMEPLSRESRKHLQKSAYGKEVVRTAKLCAFDSATGQQLWQYVFDPQEFELAGSSLANPPVASEKWVAASLNDHTLAVLDASSGALLWRFDQALTSTNGQVFTFAGDRLILFSENGDGSGYSAQALDAQTGTPVWKASLADLNPVALIIDKPALTKSDQLAFMSSNDWVQAFDLSSGELQFEVKANSEQLQVVANILYINTGNKLLAMETTTGAPLWTFAVSEQDPYLFGLRTADQVIYIASIFGDQNEDKGAWLHALNASDGRELWRKQLDQSIRGESSLITVRDPVANSEAFFITIELEDYTLTAFSAVDGAERWRFPLHQDNSPAIEGNLIFVVDRAPRWQNWLAHINPAWHE
ncbi:MAG: PQQ-binding-like beta-propeller repeat protein [Anaerolineales bacterium]|nr:PQQ-binding-like beta-propeller repeat protein [Anaerolineales bacterium]